MVGLFIALAVLVVGGMLLWLWPRQPKTGPMSGGVVPRGENLQWDATAQPLVQVPGESGDFVGRYRLIEPSGDTFAYVGRFDGRTLERRWRSPPLGSWNQNASARVFFAVVGDRVVATDLERRAHLLDLASGAERGTASLTDHAVRICAVPGSAGQAWIEVADGKHVTVDVHSGATSPAPQPPAGCEAPKEPPLDQAPRVDGFEPRRVVIRGGEALALGVRTPGTAVPMLVGFEPGATAARWQRALDSAGAKEGSELVAELADGRAAVAYPLAAGGWRLAILDAKTGKTLAEAEVPRAAQGTGPEWLVVGAGRVYVPHWTWLDVFQLQDARHVGTVGIW